MIIIGAKGFAKELLLVLDENGDLNDSLCFYDDVSNDSPNLLYGKYRIIKSLSELQSFFLTQSPEFILGVGGPLVREGLSKKIQEIGGKLTSIFSKSVSMGQFNIVLGDGICVMQNTIIENDISIGEGSLIHNNSMISHDVSVGKYCEISPGAKILGRAKIGNFCQIGTNAVVLPDISIGDNVRVGAGAVVTKNITDNKTIFGVPAKEAHSQW